jgi:hypothetical protein
MTSKQQRRVFSPFVSPMAEKPSLNWFVWSFKRMTLIRHQNMAKPPSSIPPSGSAPLQVSLLLGSPSYSPVKLALFDVFIPASLPVIEHPDEASFYPQPIIQHTFRPDEKLPPKIVSGFFAILTLAPWIVLIGLASRFRIGQYCLTFI